MGLWRAGGRFRPPVEFWCAVLIGASIIAQPLIISPHFPGFEANEQRLSALGLLPLCVALAYLLRDAEPSLRTAPGWALRREARSPARGLAARQVHGHRPPDNGQFVALELLAAGGPGLHARGRDRDRRGADTARRHRSLARQQPRLDWRAAPVPSLNLDRAGPDMESITGRRPLLAALGPRPQPGRTETALLLGLAVLAALAALDAVAWQPGLLVGTVRACRRSSPRSWADVFATVVVGAAAIVVGFASPLWDPGFGRAEYWITAAGLLLGGGFAIVAARARQPRPDQLAAIRPAGRGRSDRRRSLPWPRRWSGSWR